MTKEPCDGCGRPVRIGGGIADFWTLESGSTEGITLEFDDGGSYFLCYDCIEQLPDDREVRDEDVANL